MKYIKFIMVLLSILLVVFLMGCNNEYVEIKEAPIVKDESNTAQNQVTQNDNPDNQITNEVPLKLEDFSPSDSIGKLQLKEVVDGIDPRLPEKLKSITKRGIFYSFEPKVEFMTYECSEDGKVCFDMYKDVMIQMCNERNYNCKFSVETVKGVDIHFVNGDMEAEQIVLGWHYDKFYFTFDDTSLQNAITISTEIIFRNVK